LDSSKRKELEKKRKLLQQEYKLKELSRSLNSQIHYLNENGFSYKISPPFEKLDWISENLPTRRRDGYTGIYDDFQLNLDDSKVLHVDIEEFNAEIMKAECYELMPSDTVFTCCFQGGTPEIEFPLNAFLLHPKLFLSFLELWMISVDNTWIFEYIHEQGILRIAKIHNFGLIHVKNFIVKA
jgi:hypothetical protein